MSPKTIAIVVLILAVVGVAWLFILFPSGATRFRAAEDSTINNSSLGGENAGGANYGSAPKGERLLLQTASGALSVKNFYRNVPGVDTGTSAIVLVETAKFTIWYFRSDSSFEINLSDNASQSDEKDAEAALLSILDIESNDLCKLRISVTIPYDGGRQRSSRLPSFCPSLR